MHACGAVKTGNVRVAPPASMEQQSNHSHGCVDLCGVKCCWGASSPCRVQDSGVGSHCTLQPLPDPLHHAGSVALLPGEDSESRLGLLPAAVLSYRAPFPPAHRGWSSALGTSILQFLGTTSEPCQDCPPVDSLSHTELCHQYSAECLAPMSLGESCGALIAHVPTGGAHLGSTDTA